eukprot:CAMPEP_0201664292 /NCGR_PEP_ID=MMETSP0494-20130426/5814_1 /ASSEMBLY_ACC=CAM_ASM_000839 /TAXON_ID=420259 /ORGANISM="Thalassiosira gravida, Strain GMp14c1" /LENGTH=549 /DNA_ID=CAMNT_0048143035 /DNA_START=132 /DNA_END=1778 /DNA_ORIENTATION=+
MRRTIKYFLGLAFGLFLTWVACAYGIKEGGQSQPAAIRQRTFTSYAVSGRNNNIGHVKNVSNVRINSNNNNNIENEISSVPARKLENKITSDYLIRLEFSGVTYASWSLSVVKADIVGVVIDVLTTHLKSGIEVDYVTRADNNRKLGNSSSRILSYITLGVKISLRHPYWISPERALEAAIEILSEYVDADFRDYMRDLPGNGDYDGAVSVTEYYNDLSIGIPPVTLPPKTGSFQFNLVFTGVSRKHADSEVLRNFIIYGVTEMLNDKLDANIRIVDVSLLPWLREAWLNFPMMITLQYPASRKDAFDRAGAVLSRNVDGIEKYLNEYITETSLSDAEMLELESTLNDVFGRMISIEIEQDHPKPTQVPTQAPTQFVTPGNDWWHVNTDNLEMVWWGWVVLGAGLASVALCCCCCCVVQSVRRKRARESAAVTNNIHVREDATQPTTIRVRANDFVVSKKKKKIVVKDASSGGDGLSQPSTLEQPQNPAQVFLYKPNPCTDLVLYQPNQSAHSEDCSIEPKRRKKKKSKKKTSTRPRDSQPHMVHRNLE